MASNEINPYQSPTVVSLPVTARPEKVTAGHAIFALIVAIAFSFVTWVALLLTFFSKTSDNWPAWFCGFVALFVGIGVFRSATLGVIARLVTPRDRLLSFVEWCGRISMLFAVFAIVLRATSEFMILISPLASREYAIARHFLMAMFPLIPGCIVGLIGLFSAFDRNRKVSTIIALLGLFFCAGYLGLAVFNL